MKAPKEKHNYIFHISKKQMLPIYANV